ncbi:ATP-binding cassette sub-family C member 4-like isoform X1 [Diorhabda sublineata]|uniref:ATP-binding cassette sub-family C member 4-like isoform X1 n=1 Tax=Diorhabda sublineata TaxID=1163346 RepID=UPI0024E18DB7|nr:ATP-binding cassette sub-family C member 4-like isoform X1 [Diorhabda sublineata]
MDSTKKHDNPSPEVSANFLSKIFFCWIIPLFKYGNKHNLRPEDIYNPLPSDKCDSMVSQLERHWNKELELYKNGKRPKPSLKIALFKTFSLSYSIHGINMFIQAVILKTFQPIVLAAFIRYFDKTKDNAIFGAGSGWILGSLTVIIAFLYALGLHHSMLGGQRTGMRIRAACSSLVYRKLLRLSQVSLSKTPGGKLVNLLSNDLQRFDLCLMYLHYMWIMPVQAAIGFYLMYDSVGIAALAGTGAMILEGIPMQGYFSKLQGRLRSKIAEKTDFRVKLMSELVSGIKVIKMYSWEKYFAKVVESSRFEEVKRLAETSRIKGFTLAFMVITERFALYLTCITYSLLGNRITPDAIFSCAQLFNSLQFYMCIMFPYALSSYAEAKVSMKRLEKFLMLEENLALLSSTTEAKGNLKIQEVSAKWDGPLTIDTLCDITLELSPGTLCCVVGSVGSGKSSLLHMLLGELPIKSGKVKISGTISYASQEPWLFVSTVRDNILFGKPYIKEKYDEVVRVCALETDFNQFQFGDNTLVEERGVSLSGGQRARLNLARAVYASADIYLLDDPLSAVDTRVAKHLFERCIKGYLGTKTTILVTHQLQFLEDADVIVVMDQGKIVKVGSYNDISEKYLNQLAKNEEEIEVQHKDLVRRYSHSIDVGEILRTDEKAEHNAEAMNTGAIPFSTYAKYFGYGTSLTGFLIMCLLFILAQVASNAGDLWLTQWVNEESEVASLSHNLTQNIVIANDSSITNYTKYNYTVVNSETLPKHEETSITRNMYIIIYSITMALALFFTPLRSLNFYRIIMNASRNLHKRMFGNVLEAPMRFFDTNPSGRILSRFSNDMGIIDELLPRALLDAVQIFLVLLGILILVFIKIPWMIVPALVLGVLFYYFRIVFLKTSQDIKRLEGVNRAPVFSHLMATLDGMVTIRSRKCEEMVINEFEFLVDRHSATWYLYLASCESFGFYLDCISTLFIAIVTYQFLIVESSSIETTGNVGLVLSQCLILTGMLQLGVRQTAEVANNMTSVERVLQYANLERETEENKTLSAKNLFATFKTLNKEWPHSGEIRFRNVYLRYTLEKPPVLKNLSLTFEAGEKIGVVGRTGAGKSSLISALFRLSPIEGYIFIDDVETSEVKLSELRCKISIIPQEPVLFSATVRYNLDPFGTVTDGQIWEALEHVEMKNSIGNLETEIREGGSNFSTGQRQLMCLARAIVRNNKILVLDEATANVDPNTDALIQKTIRRNFRHCTVITIAHRLNTIMDSDKVLVMDAGRSVEFDHPHILLKNPKGYFTKMLAETGPATEQSLRTIAEDHYRRKFSDKKE